MGSQTWLKTSVEWADIAGGRGEPDVVERGGVDQGFEEWCQGGAASSSLSLSSTCPVR